MSALATRNTRKLHLKLSVLIILVVAFAYGIDPAGFLSKRFDFSVDTAGLKNVFRATMGLYIAMCALWVTGILNDKYWFAATCSNVFFMGGLAAGRLISLVVDGYPGVYFFAGCFVELLLACWGVINLKKYLPGYGRER